MSSRDRVFVGFGFGPVQAGLFVKAVCDSGKFKRCVVSHTDQVLVDALQVSGGGYSLNIAQSDGVLKSHIGTVEVVNPYESHGRHTLLEALRVATDIATALPSVDSYSVGGANSVAALIAQGLKENLTDTTLIYTAENHRHAAQHLEKLVRGVSGSEAIRPVQFLNTVIGRMSQVVRDVTIIEELGLDPITPGLDRAFLVEAYNRTLVDRCCLSCTEVGLEQFFEKSDLSPFEDLKLYSHNSTHALVGYLANFRGYKTMAQALKDPELYKMAHRALINEVGFALTQKYGGIDPIFAPAEFQMYVNDLLERMGNSYLMDAVSRVIRDPERKLGWDDRLIGAMRLVLKAGRVPENYAKGAAAALLYGFSGDSESDMGQRLFQIWDGVDIADSEKRAVLGLVLDAYSELASDQQIAY